MDVEALIGWNVARLRARVKISQQQLAARCRLVSQSYISGLENGKRNPTAVILVIISEALDVQVGELFATKGVPPELHEGPIKIRSSRSERKLNRPGGTLS